ncbi:hypothetical protein D3Z38_14175 [Clostridiales bacterium]|nr:hypothetical protein [Clostridiales bacterium]
MSLILGIDTGGTFTDIVVWDSAQNRVLQKAKAFTTPHDLAIGIKNCMDALDLTACRSLSAVHLSTTLMVNAILEDRPPKIGILLIGTHLSKKLPVAVKYELTRYRYHDSHKRFSANPATSRHLIQLFDEACPQVLVSACGTNYQDLKKSATIYLKSLLRSEIVCCSHIAANSDFYQRTLNAVTAIGAIPLITKWTASITSVIRKHGIYAPIRILTNTGSLVSPDQAIADPLSTIMSGPAASFIGSRCLTKEKDYLLLDMGGTSLDITRVIERNTRFRTIDTPVGNYAFHIKALDLQCFGTGGDSQIKLNSMGDIVVGPAKAVPLCVLGSQYPHLASELDKYRLPEGYDLCTATETDCFFLHQDVSHVTLANDEREILQLLSEGAHSLFFLANYFGVDADFLHLDRLLKKGYVGRACLTPTDILHAEGSFNRWDSQTSTVGLSLLASRKGCAPAEFIKEVKTFITNQLSFFCMQSIASFEEESFRFSDSQATMYLIEKYLHDRHGFVTSDFSIQKPIIGLGAPAKAWLPAVAKKLHAQLSLPEDGDVACAIGAAAGREE